MGDLVDARRSEPVERSRQETATESGLALTRAAE
jgi:hypothetical protein